MTASSTRRTRHPHGRGGQLLPGVPVRIRSLAVVAGTFTDEFYGYVSGPRPEDIAPKGKDECQITLTDWLGLLNGYELPDVYDNVVGNVLGRADRLLGSRPGRG